MPPAALLQQMSNEVIWMQALHHDDDRSFRFMIEPRQQRVGVPLPQRIPSALRLRVLRLKWIIDDDEIATATGQGAAHGGCEPQPARRGHDFSFGIFCGTDPGGWEYAPVEPRVHQRAKVVGVLASQQVGIADTYNPAGWVRCGPKPQMPACAAGDRPHGSACLR